MVRQIQVRLEILEVDENKSHKKSGVLKRVYFSTDSRGKPCYFKTHKAIREMLYKIIEWDYMNAPTMWWAVGHHPNFTNSFFLRKTLLYDPSKSNGD